ncbi:MAG: M23 family metallopeptidase [Pseudomonadota bacterium]
MAKRSKSLRGIICYSLCMCLAFSILSYSLYCFLGSDEPVEQSTIIAETATVDKDTTKSSTLIDKIELKLVKESFAEDTNQDEQVTSTINVIHLRDADLAPLEHDNVVIYAAEKTVEHNDVPCPETEQEDAIEESSIICSEEQVIEGEDSCIPAHGENSFEVTPEYMNEVESLEPREPIYIRDKVRNGDFAGKILNTWLSPSEIHSLLEVANKHYKLSNIRVGQAYTVTLDPYDKSFQHFTYEIDGTKVLSVRLDKSASAEEKKFIAEVTGILYDYKLVKVQGTVDNSLYGAVINAGENTALGAILTDIFGWEIDFAQDIRKGDTFTVLVEKRYRGGDFKGYGRVLSASYINGGELHEAFRFTDEFGGAAYFNRDGDSLRKAFLKAPLNFTRISSPYTMKRYHPILKKNRPHQGIDYAAPSGTPVKSVGDGTVVFRGWMNGYGNIVRIRHANNIETMYSHLSKFAANLKVNQRVRQGQVIAYVGSTGLSTGPHLDFRVRKNGQFVNPNTLLNPRSNPVSKKLKAEFAERIALYEKLEKDVATSKYMPELVVENVD